MASIHDTKSRETGAIVAAWVDQPDAPPFILPDGGAEQYRAITRAKLRCIFVDCPSPELTTVSRTTTYHHFRHLSGAQHEPESVNHANGKAVLMQHLKGLRSDVQVYAEWTIGPRRERVADVVAFDSSTGKRFAFEIQYSPLSAEEWTARTKDHQDHGFQTLWLFGHEGAQFRRSRSPSAQRRSEHLDPLVSLSSLQRMVLKQTGMVNWINPMRRVIGTALGLEMQHRSGARLFREPLASLDIDSSGVTTPLWRAACERRRNKPAWLKLLEETTPAEIEEFNRQRAAADRAKRVAELEEQSRAFARLNARLASRRET